jgi:UPF0716 protein FxsA
MFLKLFLVFALVPAIELALLIQVGSYIGIANTIFIILLTATVGAYLVRSEGTGVMFRLQKNMQEGVFPGEELIDGAMILVSGALLLTPGIGFLMVLPFTRGHIKNIAKRYLKKRMKPDEIEIDIS